MKEFTYKELSCKCCGRLPPEAKANAEALVDNVLDPARELLGEPIHVNSGFRCPAHNAAVGAPPKANTPSARPPTSPPARLPKTSNWPASSPNEANTTR